MFEPRSFGDWLFRKLAAWKVGLLNPGNILDYFVKIEHEKLPHSLEVSELENKENSRCVGTQLGKHSSLMGRQGEKMGLIFCRKPGKIVNCGYFISADDM